MRSICSGHPSSCSYRPTLICSGAPISHGRPARLCQGLEMSSRCSHVAVFIPLSPTVDEEIFHQLIGGLWWFIPLFIGFQPSKVVQDFFHPQLPVPGSIHCPSNQRKFWCAQLQNGQRLDTVPPLGDRGCEEQQQWIICSGLTVFGTVRWLKKANNH